jgi:hypothetical protein
MSDMAIAIVATALLILLILVFAIFRRGKLNSSDFSADMLNTPYMRLLLSGVLILVLTTIALIAIAALNESREQTRQRAGESLRAVSTTTEAALSTWLGGLGVTHYFHSRRSGAAHPNSSSGAKTTHIPRAGK